MKSGNPHQISNRKCHITPFFVSLNSRLLLGFFHIIPCSTQSKFHMRNVLHSRFHLTISKICQCYINRKHRIMPIVQLEMRIPVAELIVLLRANSHIGKHSSQSSYLGPTKHLNTCSTDLCSLSVYPSD